MISTFVFSIYGEEYQTTVDGLLVLPLLKESDVCEKENDVFEK